MPLSRLEIEQTAQDRWVARVEVGGSSNYCITVWGNTFAHIIAECERAYYEKRPDERPLPSASLNGGTVAQSVQLPDEETLLRENVRPKRVMSDEHKRAMAEGRARARIMKDFNDRATKNFDEGPDAA